MVQAAYVVSWKPDTKFVEWFMEGGLWFVVVVVVVVVVWRSLAEGIACVKRLATKRSSRT